MAVVNDMVGEDMDKLVKDPAVEEGSSSEE